jgi:hypothetical protein
LPMLKQAFALPSHAFAEQPVWPGHAGCPGRCGTLPIGDSLAHSAQTGRAEVCPPAEAILALIAVFPVPSS